MLIAGGWVWVWAGVRVAIHLLQSLGPWLFRGLRFLLTTPSSTVVQGHWEGGEPICAQAKRTSGRKGSEIPTLTFEVLSSEKACDGRGRLTRALHPERRSGLETWGGLGWPGYQFWAQPLLVQPLTSPPLGWAPIVEYFTRKIGLPVPIPH